MVYKVSLTALAEEDAYTAFDYIWRETSLEVADQWLKGLFDAIFSLATVPNRCPLIPEAEEVGREVRQLLYGKRSGMYRILFDIQDVSPEGSHVRILRIRHGSRDRLRAEDLEADT